MAGWRVGWVGWVGGLAGLAGLAGWLGWLAGWHRMAIGFVWCANQFQDGGFNNEPLVNKPWLCCDSNFGGFAELLSNLRALGAVSATPD